MLSFTESASRFSQTTSRRDFLRIGATGLAGLSLPGLLRAEALAGAQATGRSIINIYLTGGPSHIDTKRQNLAFSMWSCGRNWCGF